MPRDSNGNYTLPAGNPVVTGEVISTGWANPTMSDIGAELTNSLDRQGRGGMLAPFKFVDGTNGAPGITWTSEPTTGFYRAGASDMRATVAGVARMRWASAGVDVYDAVAGTWVALSNAQGANFAVLNAQNKFTQQQVIINTAPALALWKDATPTLGARFGYNIAAADGLELALFASSAWRAVLTANATNSYFDNDTHTFRASDQATQRALLDSNGLTVGSSTYATTTGATRWVGVVGTQAEVGAYCNDGTNNPRTALFAVPANVGLDYSYGNGISEFEFRRGGTRIFGYNNTGVWSYGVPFAARDVTGTDGISFAPPATGGVNASIVAAGSVTNIQIGASIQLVGGKALWVMGANDVTRATFKVDSNGPAYWNTDSTVTSFQWYLDNVLKVTLSGQSFALLSGTNFTMSDSGNVNSRSIRCSAADLVIDTRGGLLHWQASNLTSSYIQIQTTDPATTGAAGVIVLVYE